MMSQSWNIKQEPLDIKPENNSSSDCEEGFDLDNLARAPKSGPYDCHICHKQFSQKSYLTIHMCVHTGKKPYECDICHMQFIQSIRLKVHKRKHHIGVEKPRDKRKQSLPTAQSIDTSISTHDKRNNSDNDDTTKPHNGPKKHECQVCHRRFIRGDLTKHMRTHTGEKPFQCNICQDSFAEKSNHTRHMRIHSRKLPHVCNICQKIFTQNTKLNAHMRNIHAKNTTEPTVHVQFRCIKPEQTEVNIDIGGFDRGLEVIDEPFFVKIDTDEVDKVGCSY